MKQHNDGGPAFPIAGKNETWDEQGGMSLRDHFAAKAMLGFICEPVDGVQTALFTELSDKTCSLIAESSYRMADAMLKARKE